MSRDKIRELKLEEEATQIDDDNLSTSSTSTIKSNQDLNASNHNKFSDYLNKFDTFINESKQKLKTLETNPKYALIFYLFSSKIF